MLNRSKRSIVAVVGVLVCCGCTSMSVGGMDQMGNVYINRVTSFLIFGSQDILRCVEAGGTLVCTKCPVTVQTAALPAKCQKEGCQYESTFPSDGAPEPVPRTQPSPQAEPLYAPAPQVSVAVSDERLAQCASACRRFAAAMNAKHGVNASQLIPGCNERCVSPTESAQSFLDCLAHATTLDQAVGCGTWL